MLQRQTWRGEAAVAVLLMVAACARDVTAPELADRDLAPAGITVNVPEFPLAGTAVEEFAVSVVTDGVNAFVPYVADGHPKAKLVSVTGSTLATVSPGRIGEVPLAAFDGTNFLFAWVDHSTSAAPVWGMFVNRSGAAVGSPFRLSTSTSVSDVFGLAYGGGKYLLMYRTNGGAMLARFVYPNRTLGTTMTIASAAAALGLTNVASDGTDFMAVYANATATAIFTRLIHADGSLSPKITVTTSGVTASVVGIAYANGMYMVTWNKRISATRSNPRAQLINQTGIPHLGSIVIDSRTAWETAPSAIPFGNRFYVGYVKLLASRNDVVYGRLVSTTGVVSAEKSYFTTDPVTHKIPLVFGVKIGTKLFFVVNRVKLGADPLSLASLTSRDLHAAVITP